MHPPRPYYPMSGNWALTQLSTGQPFFVDTESRDLTPWIVMLGRWEIFVDDLLCALARPGGGFIDIGANLGYYTVKIGGIVGPTGTVHAFEPNPDLYAFVAENVNINGYADRAKTYNLALGSGEGSATLAYDRKHAGGGSIVLPDHASPEGLKTALIQVAAIDQILPDHVADLIKIDVEGFEPLVFEGMAGMLARSPNAAIVTEVSFHHWARFGNPAEILARVAAGRRLFEVRTDGSLAEIELSALDQALDRNFISYVLMLPRTAPRTAQLKAFLKSKKMKEAPPPPPPPPPAPEESPAVTIEAPPEPIVVPADVVEAPPAPTPILAEALPPPAPPAARRGPLERLMRRLGLSRSGG